MSNEQQRNVLYCGGIDGNYHGRQANKLFCLSYLTASPMVPLHTA